jgi:hypothetical protein
MGGRRAIFIGQSGSGKTVAVMDYLYHIALTHMLLGLVIAPSDQYELKDLDDVETASRLYSSHVPSKLVHFKYTKELTDVFIKRQETIKKSCTQIDRDYTKCDTRTFLVLDDLMTYVKEWTKDPNLENLFYAGRRLDVTLIFTMQDPLGGIPPKLRTNINYVFLCKEPRATNRDKLYKHWCGYFPSYKSFEATFSEITKNYRCMVIDQTSVEGGLENQVFWYKARYPTPPFKMCSLELWDDNEEYIAGVPTITQEGEAGPEF